MSAPPSETPSIAPPVGSGSPFGPVPTVELAERGRFDTLIDARSPAEFALDRIPGAINCPVLDDEERHVVGTIYVQQGSFEARRVGGAMVAANLARHLREKFADMPATWRPLVYCWRGGMRSGAMTNWLRTVGWDAVQLQGGYKRWRRHVMATVEALVPRTRMVVVCGATGSAKTRVLHALAAQGHQTIDLEHLARHKGSLLGDLPDVAQPTQKNFETGIVERLEGFDLARPVFVEGESRKIGRIALPATLVQHMRGSACVEIAASFQARLDYLLRDYAYLGDRPDWLAGQLAPLKPLHGNEIVAGWQAMARAQLLSPLFSELATVHYDPAYARSQGAHFLRWEQRQVVTSDSLSSQAIDDLARRVAWLSEA